MESVICMTPDLSIISYIRKCNPDYSSTAVWGLLKNSAGEGKTAPTVLTKKKPRLPRPRKSPNPSPVLTGSRNPWENTWAIHGLQADLGRLLTSALTHGASEGIFYPHTEICPTRGSNSRPVGCHWRTLTNWSSTLWPVWGLLCSP
jgi:hypothetical protein